MNNTTTPGGKVNLRIGAMNVKGLTVTFVNRVTSRKILPVWPDF